MTGYVLIAFLVIFTGIYFMAYNLNSGYPYFSYVLMNINYVLIIIIPMLTMRSFAEERKNKTDQLLLAAPVKLFDIVMGKYLAMVTVFAVPCLIFCIFPIIIKSFGTAYLKVDYLSILMFFLLGCVYLAIGMFLSSLTESQIIAAVTTFGVLLLIYLWGGLIDFLPTSAASGMIGIVVFVTIVALIIYRMTGNWMIAGIIEAIGVVAVVIVSFVKSSLFENILVNIMKKLYLADVFDNVAYNKLFDVSGLILYLSVYLLDHAVHSEKTLELGGRRHGKNQKNVQQQVLPERNLQRRACSDRDCNCNRDQSGGRTASGKSKKY